MMTLNSERDGSSDEPLYIEPKRALPVFGDYDVVIAGGGIAGTAAAVAAARNGASVCVLEKGYALGGLATLGLIVTYLPICDGEGHKISGGLAEELLLLAAADNGGTIPSCWCHNANPSERKQNRYKVEFNPASYILSLEKLLIDEGVMLFYDTRCCGAITENSSGLLSQQFRRIAAIVVENKDGRGVITCKAVVDATGDADICTAAGESTVSLKTNVAAGWYYTLEDNVPLLHKISKPFDHTGASIPSGAGRGFAGDRSAEITSHILASREMIRKHLVQQRQKHPDRIILPFLVPNFPGFRMTRRLKSELEIDAHDRSEFPDSVGLIPDWRRRGPIYSIPLRALCGVIHNNLMAAGRCISAVGNGWNATRVIPACVVTGEAAGTAAALMASSRGNNRVDLLQLQELLRQQGNYLFLSEIG